MRISFIINSLSFGGTQRQLFYLARELARMNIHCQVIYFRGEHHYAQDLNELGIEVYYISTNYTNKYRAYFSILCRMIKMVRSFKADILQSFSPTSNIIAIICGMLTHTPVVTSERNVDIPMGIIARIARIVLYRFSYCLICNSTAVEEWSNRYYFLPEGKTRLIFNGIDTRQLPVRKTSNDGSLPTVLTVASFKPQKGYTYLVQAILKIIQQYRPVHFIFVGDGGEREKIEELSRKMNVRDFISFKNSTDNVGLYYEEADVFCLPSLAEGMPNAIMEAMTYGLPIVATRVGGVSDLIIHEQTGLLVSPRQPEELASEVVRILSGKRLRDRLGENAQTHIKNFGLGAYIHKYIRLYKKVIAD